MLHSLVSWLVFIANYNRGSYCYAGNNQGDFDDSKFKVMVMLNLDFSFVQSENTLKTRQKNKLKLTYKIGCHTWRNPIAFHGKRFHERRMYKRSK